MKNRRKPKLIIFEGIATAGKTTMITKLFTQFQSKGSVTFISEEETLIPIFDNQDPKKATLFLNQVIKKIKKISTDYIIIERLFMTHAFRTSSELNIFSSFEKQLLDFSDPIIILLRMKDRYIPQRIKLADKQRGVSWKHKKVGKFQDRIIYYKKQQLSLKNLSQQADIPVIVFDTSDMDWERVLKNILRRIE